MQDALLYATSNEMQRRDASAALSAILPGIKWSENERILDVGSGSGDVTVNLLAKRIPVNFELVGVDCSQQMVDYANETYGCKEISFHCMDIEKKMEGSKQNNEEEKDDSESKVLSGKFNKVFSFYCLHWVKDLNSCLKNMNGFLVPGGEAVIVFLASNPIFSMYKILAEESAWSQYMEDYEKYIPVYQNSSNPKDEFDQLLKATGFETVMLEVNEHSFTYENKNHLVKAVKATNPFINRIPEADQGLFLMDCLATLLSLDVPIKNGRIEARYNLMVALIKKRN